MGLTYYEPCYLTVVVNSKNTDNAAKLIEYLEEDGVMSDLYTEVLVKKQQTGKDKAIKGVLIFFTVLFAAAGIMMNPLILLLALVLGIVDYIFIPKLSVEFEYLYVNGELDIDRIYSQSRRKEPQAMSFPTWNPGSVPVPSA